jgi:hypothetical protein
MPSKFSVHIYGVGPLYVAVETKCAEQAHVSRAWIREVAEPYRTGHGWRVRLGHFAVQFGTCTKHPEVDEDEPSFVEHLGMRWLPYSPGGNDDDTPDQVSDQGSGGDEVRAGEPVDVRRDGVVEGSDVLGLLPLRVEADAPGGAGHGPQAGSPTSNGQVPPQDRSGA